MTLLSASPQLWLPSQFTGDIVITFPVTCRVEACDVTLNMYIYEGSVLPGHGRLLASYSQDAHFEKGEKKEISFRHTCIQTSQSRRDVGLEIVRKGEVVSAEWDDVYSVPAAAVDMTGMMMPLMMLMPMMMLPTMMEGGQ